MYIHGCMSRFAITGIDLPRLSLWYRLEKRGRVY
jgi:hypothetical protein